MPLLTENLFGALGHHWLNFDGFIYIHYAAPPYSAVISGIYLLPFGEV